MKKDLIKDSETKDLKNRLENKNFKEQESKNVKVTKKSNFDLEVNELYYWIIGIMEEKTKENAGTKKFIQIKIKIEMNYVSGLLTLEYSDEKSYNPVYVTKNKEFLEVIKKMLKIFDGIAEYHSKYYNEQMEFTIAKECNS